MKKKFLFAAVLLLIIYKLFPKKNKKMFTEQDAKIAILEVQKSYGTDTARQIEKIMRLETTHFKSKQFQLTGSAGMEIGKWKGIPKGATNGTVTMNDADKTDGADKFIKWNSVKDFTFFLAEYINRNNGNFARWYSINPEKQKEYSLKLSKIKTKFV